MTDSEVPFFTDSSVRPPTEHIYPIQTPYGDIHGLTPPPEDFDHLLGEIHSQGYHLTDPPTPPRTEGVSSPSSRSSLSGRSPSVKVDPYSVYDSLSPGTTNPTSPVSDAVMGKDMDHGRFVGAHRALVSVGGWLTVADFRFRNARCRRL